MIQMFVQQGIEEISSGNKESKEIGRRSSADFAVIQFSGVYIPHKIANIPTIVFGEDEDQYALTSIKDGVATFIDIAMVPYMYVTPDTSMENEAVNVWFPFSQPACPVDTFLDVKEVGEKIVRYAQRVNPDYPIAVAEYIPGFLKLQQEVNSAEQRAIQRFQLTSGLK